MGEVPAELAEELHRLTTEAMAAKETKLEASAQAQEARVAFNDLMKEKEQAAITEATA